MNVHKLVEVSKIKISISREELYNLLNTDNINSEKIISKSQALDKLIVEYHNIINTNKDKIR